MNLKKYLMKLLQVKLMTDNRFVCECNQYSFCGDYSCRLSKYCWRYKIQYIKAKHKNKVKKTQIERKLHCQLYVFYNRLWGELQKKNKEYCRHYYEAHKKIIDAPQVKPLKLYSFQCNQDCFNCIHEDCLLDIPSYKSEYSKMYRKANSNRLLQQQANYRAEHREELNAKAKEYYQNNKTACKERNRQYRNSHKEQRKKYDENRKQQYKYKMSRRKKHQNCYYTQYECCGWKNCPLYYQCSSNPITDNRNITEPINNMSDNELQNHQILLKMYNRLFRK